MKKLLIQMGLLAFILSTQIAFAATKRFPVTSSNDIAKLVISGQLEQKEGQELTKNLHMFRGEALEPAVAHMMSKWTLAKQILGLGIAGVAIAMKDESLGVIGLLVALLATSVSSIHVAAVAGIPYEVWIVENGGDRQVFLVDQRFLPKA